MEEGIELVVGEGVMVVEGGKTCCICILNNVSINITMSSQNLLLMLYTIYILCM